MQIAYSHPGSWTGVSGENTAGPFLSLRFASWAPWVVRYFAVEGAGRGQNPELISVSQTILLVSFTNVNYMRMTKRNVELRRIKDRMPWVGWLGKSLIKHLVFSQYTVTCNKMKCGTRRAFGTSGKAGSCKHWLVKVFYISAHSFEK